MKNITHRDNLGPNYKGVQIHALPGLHEYVGQLAASHFSKSDPVVELGAGSGALTLRLNDAGFLLQPVDLDGNDWAAPVPLKTADFNEEGWATNIFDGRQFNQVIALEVIEHLENPSKFFRDLATLILPGGKLILSTPNIFSFHSLHAAATRAELAFFSTDDCIHSGHISILPWWLLKHLAERTGFSVLHCTTVCESPASPMKLWLINQLRKIRRLRCKPEGIETIEGSNVVMILRKR